MTQRALESLYEAETDEKLEPERVHALLQEEHDVVPRPWAEGVHNIWVAITPAKVTGRRLAAAHFSAIF
jgi:hypothetical protein